MRRTARCKRGAQGRKKEVDNVDLLAPEAGAFANFTRIYPDQYSSMPTVFDPAKLGFDEDQEVSAKELTNAYYEQLPYRRLLVVALDSGALKKPYQTMDVMVCRQSGDQFSAG